MRRYLLICLLGGGVALCGCQRDESVAPETAEQAGDVVTSHREETAGRESGEEGSVQVVVRSLSIGDRSIAETRARLWRKHGRAVWRLSCPDQRDGG